MHKNCICSYISKTVIEPLCKMSESVNNLDMKKCTEIIEVSMLGTVKILDIKYLCY